MRAILAQVAAQFQLKGKMVHGEPTGSGHINDTYAITMEDGSRSVLQRINHHIFANVAGLMDNICRVVAHIEEKLQEQGQEDVGRRVLSVYRDAHGKPWVQDDAGNYWRGYPMIEGTTTYDLLRSPEQAYAAAEAFGLFAQQLADLPEPPLVDTIPNFHDGPLRYEAFEAALAEATPERRQRAQAEIAFLQDHGHMFQVIPELLRKGLITWRVIHNDTKINNILFDVATDEAMCVIDLDTVMPGSLLYDFGDMVRTTVGSAPEDEPDLDKLFLRPGIFPALLRGYIAGVGSAMSEAERDHLVFSGQMMSLLIGTRFLTDYLQGDTYFRVAHPEHNLQRCRVQFKLVRLLLEEAAEMEALVTQLWSN